MTALDFISTGFMFLTGVIFFIYNWRGNAY